MNETSWKKSPVLVTKIALDNGEEIWALEDLEDVIVDIEEKAKRIITVSDVAVGLTAINVDRIVTVHEAEEEIPMPVVEEEE